MRQAYLVYETKAYPIGYETKNRLTVMRQPNLLLHKTGLSCAWN